MDRCAGPALFHSPYSIEKSPQPPLISNFAHHTETNTAADRYSSPSRIANAVRYKEATHPYNHSALKLAPGIYAGAIDTHITSRSMTRIPERTLLWNGRGKRATRDAQPTNTVQATKDQDHKKYSFGNGELFEELNGIVANFSPHQKDLAASTGFGFFAQGKLSARFDQQFSLWLMNKVDHSQRCINVSKSANIKIFPEDVAKVFGIPHGGKVPWHFSLNKSSAHIEKIKSRIGLLDAKGSCSKAAEHFLRSCSGSLSTVDDQAFKTAFTIYVMSILKDPKSPSHWESENYLPALSNPDEIHLFDWSKCILEDVFRMCLQAKSDSKKKLAPCPAAGCLLFLHVIYLDNMDYGPLSPSMDVLPRAMLFGKELTSRLIMEDCIGLKGAPPTRCFGSGKLRPKAEVVYKRQVGSDMGGPVTNATNQQKRQRAQTPPSSPVDPVHHHPHTIANRNNTETLIAVKAFKAKCLKHLTIARTAIDSEVDALVQSLANIKITAGQVPASDTLLENGTACIENSTPPQQPCTPEEVTKMKEQVRGRQTRNFTHFDFPIPSLDLLGEENIPELTTPEKQNRDIASPIPSSPPRKTRRQSAERSPLSELKLSSQSFLNARRGIEEINLNVAASEMDFSDSPVVKKVAHYGFFASLPWKVSKGPARRDLASAREFYAWAIGNVNKNISKTWIRHEVPKFLEISSDVLLSQLSPKGYLQPDTCDAIFRTFANAEKIDSNKCAWRHFFETDFAFRVLAGEDFLSSKSIREQFVGYHINYDISHCQMFYALAYIKNNWTAVSWDMKRRQITAFAPGYSITGNKHQWSYHIKAIDALHTALRSCIAKYFDGWEMKWENWPKVLLQCTPMSTNQGSLEWCESAVLALEFCRTFDGISHSASPKEASSSTDYRAELLYDVLHLKDNKARGDLPQEFVECVY
ncbi:hypothetical protein ACP70R_034414 [Stipagrostis hirtigluma subsp. patula]